MGQKTERGFSKASGKNSLGSAILKVASEQRVGANEHLDEVAEILARGLSRLKARQSSRLTADFGESSLDCAAHQSGPANVLTDGDGS